MDIRRRLFWAGVLVAVVMAVSMSGYRLLGGPDVSFLQALYMAVITVVGVGYGEIVDTSHSPALRVFNILVVLFGVTLMVYVFSVITAFLVEGELRDLFWRRKMQKRISQLKDHYIVCGLGDTGRYALDELHATGTPHVVIESHEDNIAKVREQRPDLLYLIGDATDETVLDQAGVEQARGLIAGVASDKDNLVITVLVRQKNPNIRIVARCSDDERFGARMLKAGANSTVSPNRIGGLRLASEVLRPHVVGFLDQMLKQKGKALRIEEIEIGPGSRWCGSTVEGLKLGSKYNLMVLAVKNSGVDPNPAFWVNPPQSLVLREGAVVIVMGDMKDVHRARDEERRAAAHSGMA
ncbi:MAG: TrkA family potassium uptake protein [Terriglobales bacterium]